MSNKVLIIGLDCIPPQLIFEKYKKILPNISKLMKNGVYGELKSSMPPSSPNAWTSMAMSKSSDAIGVYDYIYRIKRSYTNIGIINSTFSKNCVWDIISKRRKKVIVINVPMTYPPRKINGIMISEILFIPPKENKYTYPLKFKKELDKIVGVGKYVVIPNARCIERENLIKTIFEITKMRFKVIKHLMIKKEWDFFIGVIYATDVLMHNFWRYIDHEHKKYEDNPKIREKIKNFFKLIDKEIGEILSMLNGNTTLILMSDHGAVRMDGRINLNDWLIKNGYLVLKEKPKKTTRLIEAEVDWAKTKVFALGAYYAVVYINMKGRDPKGIVKPGGDYENLKREIIKKMKNIRDDVGRKINTRVFEIPKSKNAPDLIVYFDNLHWGINSNIGNNSLYSWATERGPDDAAHSSPGFFIISGFSKQKGYIGERDIRDITPTVLKKMKIKIPSDMEGKPII